MSFRVAPLDCEGLTFDVSELAHTLPESLVLSSSRSDGRAKQKPEPRHREGIAPPRPSGS